MQSLGLVEKRSWKHAGGSSWLHEVWPVSLGGCDASVIPICDAPTLHCGSLLILPVYRQRLRRRPCRSRRPAHVSLASRFLLGESPLFSDMLVGCFLGSDG